MLERGKLDRSLALADGGKLSFERIYPLDADFDTAAEVPAEVQANKRYRDQGDVSIQGLADRLAADFGSPCLDIVVHSLANAPEVKNPLLETSRRGYLAAIGTSAYSFTSMLARLGPLTRPGGPFWRFPIWPQSASCQATVAACLQPRLRSKATCAPCPSRPGANGDFASTPSRLAPCSRERRMPSAELSK
jgi:hypothetical protein